MKFLEKDLEQIIFETENDLLNERGLDISGFKKRQIKIGNYGIADLVTIQKTYDYYNKVIPELNITIFELKKNEISINTFLQAIRYLKGIKSFLNKRKSYYNVNYKIVLIGDSIDKNSDFIFLTDLIDSNRYGTSFSLEFYTYDFDFNGITFNSQSGYQLTNEGF